MKFSRRHFLRLSATLGSGALSAGLWPGLALGNDEKPRPNVLMVVTDTLRADHCSCYGYGLRTTPAMDQVAREGVRFTGHIAPSCWTTPSIMSIFTGLSPLQHGVIGPEYRLHDATATLATTMRNLGYHTLGVLCNPCAAGSMGFARGFDLYDDFTILLDQDLNIFSTGKPRKRRSVWTTTTGKETTDLVLRHVAKVPRQKPLFLFVLQFDPHSDYTPPADYAARFTKNYHGRFDGRVNQLPNTFVYDDQRDLEHVRALYDAEIRFSDDQVARLLAGLSRAGRYTDRDLLIWTSDHGEEFNEHHGLQHRRTLYDEVVRVPLLMRWPEKLPAGKVVRALTTHTDLLPCLMHALGSGPALPPGAPDLMRLARGEIAHAHQGVGLHLDFQKHRLEAFRTNHHCLIRDLVTGEVEAYDLATDPGQQHPLPQNNPVARNLLRSLDAWKRAELAHAPRPATKHEPGSPKVKLTPQQVRALKSMGYLQ